MPPFMIEKETNMIQGKWVCVSEQRLSIRIHEDGKPMEGDWNSFFLVGDAQTFIDAPYFQGNKLLHHYTVVVETREVWAKGD